MILYRSSINHPICYLTFNSLCISRPHASPGFWQTDYQRLFALKSPSSFQSYAFKNIVDCLDHSLLEYHLLDFSLWTINTPFLFKIPIHRSIFPDPVLFTFAMDMIGNGYKNGMMAHSSLKSAGMEKNGQIQKVLQNKIKRTVDWQNTWDYFSR